MVEKLKPAQAFRAVALTSMQAQHLLRGIDCRTLGEKLDGALRKIAACEAMIDVLRLDSPSSRAPRTRGALSAFLWPARTPGPFDPVQADALANSGLFLPGWYRDHYSEAVAGEDPWTHYLSSGLAEARAPNPFFDPDWYADTHLDGRRDEPAILHYARIGARYALAPGPLFDSVAYLLADPTLAGEPDPLAHFLTRGLDEGRAAIPVGG